MKNGYPYVYVDYSGNFWEFFLNEKNELIYKVMYGQGKWTKESIIDKDVLGFSVYINEDETIHIVYNNLKYEIKYCTMEDKQWMGRLLLQSDGKNFNIENLEMIILGRDMHVFYIQVDNAGNDHGILNHCIWDGVSVRNTVIEDITLSYDMEKYFSINLNSNNSIDIYFMNDENDEISLSVCRFEKNKWSSVQRLYGIQGKEISFDVINYDENIHIINKSREDSTYYLDYIVINTNNSINQFRIYETDLKVIDAIIVMCNHKVYSCWMEKSEIYYSLFEDQVWTNPKCVSDSKSTLKKCKCFLWDRVENKIKRISAYITDEIDMNIFIPDEFILSVDSKNYEVNKISQASLYEDERLESVKFELSKAKVQKSKLEKKVDYLERQFKKSQRLIGEYEERISIISAQKRKGEENYTVFMELNKDLQQEVDKISKKLEDETKLKEMYKTKIEEINTLLDNEKKDKLILEDKLKGLEEENKSIKIQIESIKTERNKLIEELDIERNQSIMDKLLRKKPGKV